MGTRRSLQRSLCTSRRLYACTLARLLFVPLVAWLSRGDWAAPTLLLVIIGFVGVSNGLVGTLAFIRAQAMVDEADQELGSRIMVLALYCGIAAGSTFAALVFRNDTSGGGGTINGTVNGAP
mmetsp:Transcript_66855/g.132521  ORF Transcript_66855/g.132521 Transcript_66855/m.132521 type:complete len:122 (-) Transcript_66855:61-426(-)